MYKLTTRFREYRNTTSNTRPGKMLVSLAGETILTLCARHVVAKAASNAATVYFIVLVMIGESLELVAGWLRLLYIAKRIVTLRIQNKK